METRIDEIAAGIYRLSTFVPEIAPPAGLNFNQFLVLGDAPLLFHTGPRQMFPARARGARRLIAPERLRWITFGHYEADECGAMNEWLAVAPQAEVAHGQTGCLVSLNDMADRAAARPAGRRDDRPRRQAGALPRHAAYPAWLGGGRALRGDRPARCCAATCSPSSATSAALTGRDIVGPAIAAEDIFRLLQPQPRHGHDDPPACATRAAHARADARPVLRGRRRRRAARARRRLRPPCPRGV